MPYAVQPNPHPRTSAAPTDLARRDYDGCDKTGREMHLNPNDNDDDRSVALYWDFENLHAGLMEAKYGEGASSCTRSSDSAGRVM